MVYTHTNAEHQFPAEKSSLYNDVYVKIKTEMESMYILPTMSSHDSQEDL